MHGTTIRSRDWSRSAIAMLAALLVAAVVLIIARTGAATSAQTRVDAIYQKAFYETCELTESLAVNYAKLIVTGTNAQAQTILNDISRQAQGALSNLAMLPLGEETVSATIKFVNQAGDFAATLSQKLAGGEAISQQDYETMQTISGSATAFSQSLNQLMVRYAEGEEVFTQSDMTETGAEELYPLTGAASDYPTLLYDGPFADVERGGSYKALENLYVVSQEEAQAQLAAFLGTQNAITYEGESDLQVKCYEFSVNMGEYSISAGVTQQGGKVLYMLSDAQIAEPVLGEEECARLAQEFLASRGYGETEMSYYSRYGGVLTVNFACVEEGVVLYPDLIKVQVDMRDGSVIGMEAHGYLRNHVLRELSAPEISREQALTGLSPTLNAQDIRLCVIPQNGEEYLCYEVTATSSMGMFMVYVDAMTGEEREILQVVNSETGTLVM